MRYASLSYSLSANVGDNIQSMAAEQHLPCIDSFMDRDFLATTDCPEKTLLVMNGWFAQSPKTSLPAHKNIIPVFFGFHVHKDIADVMLTPSVVDYLKKWQPIGCRDLGTCEILADRNIEVFYSKCPTLTFPKRKKVPENGRVFIVDAHRYPIPQSITSEAIHISQIVSYPLSNQTKRAIASEYLSLYREQASLVITSKIHCAMPCAAMGVPVVFIGNTSDYRIKILKDVGIPMYHYHPAGGTISKLSYKAFVRVFEKMIYAGVDWSPAAVDIDAEQQLITGKLRAMIQEATLR